MEVTRDEKGTLKKVIVRDLLSHDEPKIAAALLRTKPERTILEQNLMCYVRLDGSMLSVELDFRDVPGDRDPLILHAQNQMDIHLERIAGLAKLQADLKLLGFLTKGEADDRERVLRSAFEELKGMTLETIGLAKNAIKSLSDHELDAALHAARTESVYQQARYEPGFNGEVAPAGGSRASRSLFQRVFGR